MKRSEITKLGVVACIACCAPLLVLGAIAGAGAIGAIWFGLTALVVAAAVIGVVVGVRSPGGPR